MIIGFHANCFDGTCAAYLLKLKYPDATFVAMKYGDEIEPVHDDMIFVDFCPTLAQLKLLDPKRTLVLDHHQTALPTLLEAGVPYKFRLDASGAMLALEHIVSLQYKPSTELVRLVRYVQDRDLWQWLLPFSREVSAAIASRPQTFASWATFRVDDLIEEGKIILKYQNQTVAKLAAHYFIMTIAGHEVKVANTPILHSEVGEVLCKDRAFAMTFFISNDNMATCSLRSNKDGIDVSEVAKRYGGGGHKHAAGFKIFNIFSVTG